MQTWFFALKTDPLTADQIDALDTGAGGPVSLSAYGDGTIMAAVEADDILDAVRHGRDKVWDAATLVVRVTALHGELADSVADVVFQAAERLRGKADSQLLRHVVDLWASEAWEMAGVRAREEKCFDRHRNPVPSVVVRPIEHDVLDSAMVERWTRIWHAAKACLGGTDDEWLTWREARRQRRLAGDGGAA